MDYSKTVKEILIHVGGEQNVTFATHCFTRLRLYLRDTTKMNLEELNKINGIIEARFQNEQLQLVIGNEVADVYNEILPYLKHLDNNDSQNFSEKESEGSVIDKIFSTISGIFTPILPAIIGAGLMKGILALFQVLNIISAESGTYSILYVISDASFYFLPILIAISSSRKFKVNEYLGVALAAALLYPSIVNQEGTIQFLNVLPIPQVAYASSVIPIILGVWAMSYIYRFMDKIIPKLLRMIFTPLAVLLVSIPLTLIVFGPLGFYIGSVIANVSLFLADTVPYIYGAVLGGFYSLIVMTGMHYAFFPIMLNNINVLGYDNGFLPMGLFSNLALATVTLAIAIKAKNRKNKEVGFSTAVSAYFGISEPALYGVILKNKKSLYVVMIVSGIVNAVTSTLGVKAYAFVSPGLLTLPAFMTPDGSMKNFYITISGVAASIILSFILTSFLKFDENADNIQFEQSPDKGKRLGSSVKTNTTIQNPENTIEKKAKGNFFVQSPLNGTIKNLSECSDQVFASGAMGSGVMIEPNEGVLTSPVNGEIVAISDGGHAIGIKSEEGVELLIHVGIDTVELKGSPFEISVKIGQKVNLGEHLSTINLDEIKEKGYSIETPIIVTNSFEFFEVKVLKNQGQITKDEDILEIIF